MLAAAYKGLPKHYGLGRPFFVACRKRSNSSFFSRFKAFLSGFYPKKHFYWWQSNSAFPTCFVWEGAIRLPQALCINTYTSPLKTALFCTFKAFPN
jgi:hypothetical protein